MCFHDVKLILVFLHEAKPQLASKVLNSCRLLHIHFFFSSVRCQKPKPFVFYEAFLSPTHVVRILTAMFSVLAARRSCIHAGPLPERAADSHLDLCEICGRIFLCGMSQQYYCSAAAQAKHDNLVSRADLTAKVPLRTLKHVNSLAISTLARQKMPFSAGYTLY